MDIKVTDGSLEKYKNFVLDIAKEYTESLNNKFLFLAKCHVLEVTLCKSPLRISSGKFMKGPKITISIYPGDPDEYVAFVIAHEFAHLLFDKVDDVLMVSGRAIDESTYISAIQRADEYGVIYGRSFEEACADIVGKYIVSNLNYENPSNKPLKRIDGSNEAPKLIEKLANCFGVSLSDQDKIDDFSENNKLHIVCIKNIFWYAIITFSFSEIINEYDLAMGKGAFREFCDMLDVYERVDNKSIYQELNDKIETFRIQKNEEITISV